MSPARPLSFIALCCLLPLLPGCALLGEKHQHPQQLTAEQIHLADSLRQSTADWPSQYWWKAFRDPQLDTLIEQGLKDAPSLEAVRMRTAQAHSQAQLVASATSLQVSALALLNRQKASSNGFLGPYAENQPKLGLTGPWYTEGTLGLFADLDLDVWGRNKAALAASVGVENARKAEAEQAELQLSTGVAQLYYSLQTTWQLIALLQHCEQVLQLAVDAHQHKAATGLEARIPLAGARGELLAIQRKIASAQSQATEILNTLTALIGSTHPTKLLAVPLPQPVGGIPADLPYSLLARRADLQAWNAYVQASLNEIEVARTAFYPSFDIKAFFGVDSIHMSQLFKHDSQQINLIPGLYLPVFNGGRLRANWQDKNAASDELIQRYNQAVLDAVRDVANRGDRLQSLEQEWSLQSEKVEAAHFTQRALEAAHSQGLASRVSAAEGRLPALAEEISLLILNGQRLSQNILLIESLGGGYEAQPNPDALEQ